MPETIERPAPPPGVEVLTVPEAHALSVQAAQVRGDTRGIITKQDINRELRRGGGRGLNIGRDAWWVDCPAHPSRGYWVLFREAVERRIQERLMGRGRPRQSRPDEDIPAVAQPPEVETAGKDPVMAGAPIEAAEPVRAPLAASQQVPPVVAAVGGDGPVAWPVLDPARYREAVRRAVNDTSGRMAGVLFLCRNCGWAGLAEDFDRRGRSEGGWDEICPGCGAIRRALEGEISYVVPAARELSHLVREVDNEAGLTRNAKWASKQRGHLRHLTLLSSQAQLEEEITPGVAAQVATLQERVNELLAEQVILPAIMRNRPSYKAMEPLVEPRVHQVVGRIMSPLRLTGDLPEGLSAGSPMVVGRAILGGTVPAALAIPVIRSLVDRSQLDEGEMVARLVGVIAREAGLLEAAPADERLQATAVEAEIEQASRRSESWHDAAREWARRDYGQNRYRWERYQRLASDVHALRESLTSLLSAVVRVDVEERVAAEVERLAALAAEEAERRHRQPLEVAASWIGKKASPIPAELRGLVVYPLAQRLGR